MQVLGLPALYPKRAGGVAFSRGEDPTHRSGEKTRRRPLARSHGRQAHRGLGRKTVGVKRATLYRWKKKPEPESRRPHSAAPEAMDE